MCGIFGARGKLAGDTVHLAAAAARQQHRGPDGFGEWSSPDRQVYLAHNRLAIIDLTSASSQPFQTAAGVLVYNGEIYNYLELRAELVAAGARFVTDGDTEVLATVIERWGLEGLARVRGMFAFAYYSRATGELTLVRDRFGIKPLYVAERDGTVFFSSEVEPLRALGFTAEDEDARAIYHLLNYLPAPFTFYRGIVKVPPGHLARVRADGYTLTPWYRLAPRIHGELGALLERSVREHMRCDVDYGVFLSGGLDSNIIASLASDVAPGRISTFSIGFSRFPSFDETPWVRLAAAHLGSEHHQFDIDAEAFEEAARACLDKISRGEPFADASFIPTWLVSQRTRQSSSKVALSGDGADEVFGGYRKYRGIRAAAKMRLVPQRVRALMLDLSSRLPEARDSRALELARRFRKFLQGAGKEQNLRQLAWLYTFFPDEVERFLPGSGLRAEQRLASGLYYPPGDARGEHDEINDALYADTTIFLAADMLHKVDLASMDHSLEVRVPFLDHEVVETAFALPGARKVGYLTGKLELRRLFGKRLPEALLRLPKRGFESPLSSLFRTSFAAQLRAEAPRLAAHGIPVEYLGTLEREHAASRADHSIRMWNLLVFARWLGGAAPS